MSLTHCPSCQEPNDGPRCVSCGRFEPPPLGIDPWSALGLPRRWALSPAELDQAWKARSRQVHPDRFIGAPTAQRRAALAWTAAVNEARRSLKTASGRALWLSIGRPDLPERGGPTLDPDFLEWVFDQQVALEASPQGVASAVAAAHAELMASLDAIFAQAEPTPPPGSPALAAVPALIARLRYLDQLTARLDAPR